MHVAIFLSFRFFSYFIPRSTAVATDNTAVTVWPQSDRVFTSTETNRIIEVDADTLKTKDTVKNCE